MWVPTSSGNRSESCSENCGLRIAQVVRRHSENGISHSKNQSLNYESCSENTPELSESSDLENGLFTPRAFSCGSQASDLGTPGIVASGSGFRALCVSLSVLRPPFLSLSISMSVNLSHPSLPLLAFLPEEKGDRSLPRPRVCQQSFA